MGRRIESVCLIYGTPVHVLAAADIGTYPDQRYHNASPEGVHRVTAVGNHGYSGCFLHYVTAYGWTIFEDSFERGRTTGSLLDLPSWIAELPVPVFFAVLGVQAVIEIWKLISGKPIPKGGHE